MEQSERREKAFTERVLIVIGASCLAFLLILLLYYTFDVILLIFAGVLLAIFFRGLAGLLGRFLKIGEGWRVLIAAGLVAALLAGAIVLLAPSVGEQINHLRVKLPESLQLARDYISRFGWGRAIIDQLPSASELAERMGEAGMLTRVGGVFSSTIGAIGNFFITILLAIYFATEPRFYARGFLRLFPIDRRPRLREVIIAIDQTLSWWLIGKAGSMIFIGLLTWIGLWILGVPLALTLGLIAGLLSFIPNFGPIISAVPALLLGFIESPFTAVKVAILFVIVQLIESNIVTPLIERETVELPPGLTIIFQLSLAVLVGGLGLVLATPLLAAIMVVVQMIYIEDVLGDRKSEGAG
ncbi:MAG: AI-2E family transporter [Acidobacteria bacterium]|nr:AI-2E family transporter [Acidobacteriota bacterium]MCA1608641.1 AI-2E family transporter [Acidobacteriota bacterium]